MCHEPDHERGLVSMSKKPRLTNQDDKDKGLIPVAILCDNTRDLEMIPSNLSDFNHVTLIASMSFKSY